MIIDSNTIVTVLLYDEEHEEHSQKRMTIGEMLDRYTEEGCPWEEEECLIPQ